MSSTVDTVDARYRADWSKWPVPVMPDLPFPPWHAVPGQFWREPVFDRAVDWERTRALQDVDVSISVGAGAPPWQGSTYGMPYQLIDANAPTTPVWDQSQWIRWHWFTPTFPIIHVPLPPVVRREGDPNGSSDLHWTGYDPERRVLWEGITLRHSPLNRWQTWGQCDWVAGYMGGGPGLSKWDTSKPWNAPGQPTGVVAAGVPKLPMVCRWDEIQSGRIEHAIFGVLPNYAPAKVGHARGTDGSLIGHPVRAGERLRLRRAAVERFSPGTAARIIAQAMHEFGWFQADKNAATGTPAGVGVGGFPLSQDRRWHTGDTRIGPLGDFRLRLTDFEVIAQ